MPVIIGLDVGTTAVKAVAFDTDSPWRRAALREYPLLEPEPRWQVQDPGTVLAAVDEALAQCVAACEGRRVDAVGLSSAMHGLVGLGPDLRPVTPVLTWADSRAHAEARELRREGRARDLLHLTGTPVHPMSPLTKLRWFARHGGDVLGRVHRWADLKALLLLHLTGTFATELSSASGTGLLDLRAREWAPTALEIARIGREALPEVLPTTAVLGLRGAVAARVGLPAGTPLNVGAADGPLGNLGTGATGPGVAGLSVGTSGAVRVVVPEPRSDPDGRLFCYALTEDAWVVGGAVSNGGLVLRWAADTFAADLSPGPQRDAAVLDLACQVPPGSDGLVMLPYLLGERAPLWDPDLRGAYLGVRRSHSREHFLRAAVEGVSLQLAGIVDLLEQVTPVDAVRATGGVFRSRLWQVVVAGALGKPLVLAGDAEGTALGAAALARYATGEAPTLMAAVAELTFEHDEATIEAGADDVALYAALRRSVPALLDAYTEMREHLSAVQARAGQRQGTAAAAAPAPERREGTIPSSLPE
ncbi:gluconokinase [Georgenia faecalis]|uniref:Gluconokinase n=1 Tax=Georgenia faecalis TaxID=2483799 RepID=A0ABV9D945_9MICO|nr:gluconokinase [Georgenia faecalis]